MEEFLENNRASIASFCFGVLFALLGVWYYSSRFLLVDEEGVIEIVHAEQEEQEEQEEQSHQSSATDQVLGETDVSGCVNINTASKAELITLPHIGDKRADLVIEGRPYHSLLDIKRVKGIADVRYEQLKPLICL